MCLLAICLSSLEKFLSLFVSNLILLWLNKTFCVSSVIKNLLRYVLWPSIYSSLKNYP